MIVYYFKKSLKLYFNLLWQPHVLAPRYKVTHTSSSGRIPYIYWPPQWGIRHLLHNSNMLHFPPEIFLLFHVFAAAVFISVATCIDLRGTMFKQTWNWFQCTWHVIEPRHSLSSRFFHKFIIFYIPNVFFPYIIINSTYF